MTQPRSLTMLCWTVCSVLSFGSGCASRVTSVYGESDDYNAKCSPAGTTVLRAMVEERGHKTYTVRSLSPANMERLNTLIWCPDDFPNHRKATFTWIEQWMARGNRTLVYIGRDFSPHAAYWADIAGQQGTNPANRSKWLVAIEEVAGAENELDSKRRLCRPSLVMPWCRWDLRGGRIERIQALRGPWSQDINVEQTNIFARSSFFPLRSSELKAMKSELESTIASRKTAPPGVTPPPTTTPTTTPAPPPPAAGLFGVEDVESQQIDVINGINAESFPEWELLLSDPDLGALVGIADIDPVKQSRVIVVNNNSLFCNHSMLRVEHRKIAAMMIDEFSEGGVGFISGADDPTIRTDDFDERQRGFEMLTVWPLNVVAIHAAFLGIATMIACFPIFGRPKRLRKASTADFGMHVEAIGNLMQKSGDKAYAIDQIADYFRTVRGDLMSPWANMQPEESKPLSPFRPPQSE
jgi:hypothetical protein